MVVSVFLSWELLKNLPSWASRSATITQWDPEKLLPPVRFQALVGCLRLTTDIINSSEQKRLIMFWLVGSKIITEQWIGGYLILDGSIYISNSAIDGLSRQTIGQKRQYIWNNLRKYLGVLVKMFGLEVLEGPKTCALLKEKLKLK